LRASLDFVLVKVSDLFEAFLEAADDPVGFHCRDENVAGPQDDENTAGNGFDGLRSA
jgi:hypothetical protein